MTRLSSIVSFSLLSLGLLACSGNKNIGGANSQDSSTPGQAQGVYVGTTSTGLAFDGIVLPNDKFYAIYGTTSGNLFFVCGLTTGQGTSSSGKYTANDTDFDYCGGSLITSSGTVSATYTQGTSLNGTLTEGTNNETFSGSAPASSQFNYNSAATLSSVTGSWNGSLTDGESASITVNSAGSLTGISSTGCTFSATLTPDSSGKNFFNISLTFGASPCLLANQSATGVGVNYLLSDGVTSQLIAAVNSGTSFGIVFAAQR